MDGSTVDKCSKCESDLTVKLYRSEDGWQCSSCAPSKTTCSEEGCTHQDLPHKCKKHELFFCPQGTLCWSCEDSQPRGTLLEHYKSLHTVFDSNFSFRVHNTDCAEEYCFVASPVGSVVCKYWSDLECILRFYMPVLSEQLCQYKCEVRVVEVSTGCMKTYVPDVMYNKEYDWYIKIDEKDFPKGNFVFDVFVNITRI